MSGNRELLRIVTVGHVDHGKSTVIGRLLYDTKSVPEGVIDRVKKVCEEKGKSFEYAYLLDAFEEEQKQGITIDITELQFKSKKRDYVIIDAPGHKEFLKNMISGAASAEGALLIIDSNEGIQEQSKRHGYILSLLGIKQVYVVVNKMDLIEYSEEKFNKIKEEMNKFLLSVGVAAKKFIPISAYYGENILNKSENLNWYKGETILEALDIFTKEKALEDKLLRFPIQDVYKFDNRRIIVGRVESGKIAVGDKISISPSNKVTRVKSIEYLSDIDKRDVEVAGRCIGITVEDEFFNKRGEVITHLDTKPLSGDTILANIVWMGKTPLVQNKKYKLKLVTQEVECEVINIKKVIDATTLKQLLNEEIVKINDIAEIVIKTKEKIAFDKFENNTNTGRFVIVDGYDVSGGGIVAALIESTSSSENLLIKEDKHIKVDIFDEYYLTLPGEAIQIVKGEGNTIKVGNNISLKGESYSYSSDLDILSIENNLVAIIRNTTLKDIIELERYSYSKVSIVNEKGFKIKVENKEQLSKYIKEYSQLTTLNHQNIQFYNKWLEFGAFRGIKYREETTL